jgi:hypothetical protein
LPRKGRICAAVDEVRGVRRDGCVEPIRKYERDER